MAGGMTSGGRHFSAGRPASDSPPHRPDLPPPADVEGPTVRHCLVRHADGEGVTPALPLGWERRQEGWYGLMVLARVDDEAVITVSRWIEEDRPLPPG